MKLQDRNLSIGMQGDDVKLLHSELIQLGFEIPAEELESLIDVDPQPARFGPGTRQAVGRFQDGHGLELNGTVDERTAVAINAAVETEGSFLVQGQVRHTDRTLIPELIVRAYDRGIGRKVLLLGQDVTNAEGHYEINYKTEVFARLRKLRADLFVKVFSVDEVELLESEIRFGAQPIETVDFVIASENYRGLSEYQQLIAKLTPLLQDMQLGDLQENDIEYLAGKTGTELQQIAHIVASEKLAQQTSIPPEVFYGGLRQNLPTTLPTLLEQNPDVISRALESAVADNIISTSMRERSKEFLEQLPSLKAEEVLKPSTNGRASLGDLLNTIPPTFAVDQERARLFADVVVEQGADTQDLWERAKGRGLSDQDIVSFQLTFALRDLTSGHLPLMADIHERRGVQEDSLAFLAELRPTDWARLVFLHDVPSGSQESLASYAQQLQSSVEVQFPTQVFAARLRQGELDTETFPVDEVSRFLQEHPDFDFQAKPVEMYLQEKGLPPDTQPTDALQMAQRVVALTQHWGEVKTLLKSGVNSAAQIVELGEEGLAEHLYEAIDPIRASELFLKAKEVNAVSMVLATSYSTLYNPDSITVLPPVTGQSAVENYPSLSTLFSALSYCECRHCRSVLSPAAYFVDLLQFLKNSSTAMDYPALGSLLQRRPDLSHLHLTCENTNTEIPYIDLVLELLENAVGLPFDVQLPPNVDVETALKQSPAPQWLVDGLKQTTTTVGQNLTIEKSKKILLIFPPSIDYSITDGARSWWVRYWQTQLLSYSAAQGPMPPRVVFIGAAAETLMDALDQGQLNQQLQDDMLPPSLSLTGIYLPMDGQPQVTKDGNDWIAKYKRGVNIQFRGAPKAQIGILQVYAPDGTLFGDPIRMSPQMWPGIEAEIAGLKTGGTPNQFTLDALNIPRAVYFSTYNRVKRYWELRLAGEIRFIRQPARFSIWSLAFQSSSIQQDLLASPENRNIGAYNRLRQTGTVFPWSLPFDLWTEEVRGFLKHLGVPRGQLMDIARPQLRWRSTDHAYEQLDLSTTEAAIIAQTTLPADLWTYWGLQKDDNDIRDHELGANRRGGWLELLSYVSMLLQQSRLSMSELTDVLQTRFVRTSAPTLEIPALECQPSEMRLQDLRADHLHRIHRFVRLWRKLKWPTHELDSAIAVLGGELDQNTLVGLALLQGLRERLRLAIAIMASWVGTLDTRAIVKAGQPETPSQYAIIFLRPALQNPPDPDFILNGSQPAGAGKTLSEKRDLLSAALGITSAEVVQILAANSRQDIPDALTLDSLTALYGVVSFSRVLHLRVADYLRACLIFDLFPFARNAATPLQRLNVIWTFIDKMDFIQQSGFTIDEVDYLLRHATIAPFTNLPDQHQRLLTELRAGLSGVHHDVSAQVNTNGLATQLAKLGWPTSLIENAREIVEYRFEVAVEIQALNVAITIPNPLRDKFFYREMADSPAKYELGCIGLVMDDDFAVLKQDLPNDDVKLLKKAYEQARDGYAAALAHLMQSLELPTFQVALALVPEIPAGYRPSLYYSAREKRLVLLGWLNQDELDALKAAQDTTIPANKTAIDQTFDTLFNTANGYAEGNANNVFLRQAEITDLLTNMPFLEDRIVFILARLEKHLLRDFVVTWLAEALDVERVVLKRVLTYLTNALDTLTSSAFALSDLRTRITATQFPELFDLMVRLHKIALLLNRVRATESDVAWLTNRRYAVLDLVMLPVSANNPAAFEDWQKFVQLFRLRDTLPDSPVLITAIEAARGAPVVRQILADALELDKQSVTDACAADVLNMTGLADYRNPARLLELVTFLHMLTLLGTTTAKVKTLIANPPDSEAALLARQLFRAQFGPETWAERIKPVSDYLRERQRDALVAYLVHMNGLRDVDALHDYYLIDVQMDSCARTSRIKQAISAVQLFVQQVFLNLTDVKPESIKTQLWAWMKNYRVWEANRKVFLYPENWIEPELRDDKSEIFRQLESDLLQSDLTHEQAVNALRRYLDKFNDIAHLTVVAMFEEQVAQNGRVIHIVGCTQEQPLRHFYRQWILSDKLAGYWTPWEEITLSINSDHVMLFELNGVIHVAWAAISKSAEDGWRVQMQWGRRTTEGWTDVKKSRETLSHPALVGKDERTTFTFRVVHSSSNVSIECFGAEDTNVATTVEKLGDRPNPFASTQNDNVYAYSFARVLGKVKDSEEYWPIPGVTVTLSATKTGANGVYPYPLKTAVTGSDGTTPNLDVVFGMANDVKNDSLKFELQLALDTAIGTTSTPVREFELSTKTGQYHDSLWHYPEFIINLKINPKETAAFAERKVGMKFLGSYLFESDGSTSRTNPLGPALPLPSYDDRDYYSSALRERGDRKNDAFSLESGSIQLWIATPGRFFLSRSIPQSLGQSTVWAYKDDAVHLFILRSDSVPQYHLLSDGHDYAKNLRRAAYLEEVEGVLNLSNQKLSLASGMSIASSSVDPKSYTARGVDFDLSLPYSSYNWEIFFHIPLLIATQLSKSQRFAEAERWFHLIFDPTTSETPDPQYPAQRYWRFEPFRKAVSSSSIEHLLQMLAQPDQQPGEEQSFEDSIGYWKAHPFQPHAIARTRLRAYQFTTVMKFLDNNIAWGDYLFRSERPELVEESTQLYILVARLLGDKPHRVPQRPPILPMTYSSLSDRLDKFSNAWIGFEGLAATLLQFLNWQTDTGISSESGVPNIEITLQNLESLGSLYFCVPQNDKLIDYWNIVEDRLFNLRHCRNIDGIERQLPLFEPPIDPALLVRATAAGLNLAEVMANINAPLPHYRFSVMVQKALELCAELKSMGAALLSALEKQDAEALALLRSSHEIELLKRVGEVRTQQVAEAQANLNALDTSRKNVFERYKHYQRLLGKTDITYPAKDAVVPTEALSLKLSVATTLEDERNLGLIQTEQDQLARLSAVDIFSLISGSLSSLAGLFHAIPNRHQKDPTGETEFGGSHLGHATGAGASFFSTLAGNASHHANRAAILSQYQRRQHDWVLQSNLAAKEIEQIDKQIIAADIRLAIANHELENHQHQVSSAQEVDVFMREKYTNQQLYRWMVGQISAVYFRTYQLAYNVAKRAERTFRYELGLQDSNLVQFGYWDSLKKGLMSGERLYLDVKRMDLAYLEQNQREYEITQHFSLAMHDPAALIALKATGRCNFEIGEILFDLSYPGHYMRRIKSFSVTIPSVTGPYTSLNCTLTLHRSSIRHSKLLRDGEYAADTDGDSRITEVIGARQSIVTSNGLNDSGLFETSLRDERYLPFEGLGAISTWQIDLPRPSDFPAFDYDTITDVILHIRYTAREGGDTLREHAISAVRDAIQDAQQYPLARLFSLHHEFATEWHRFMHTAEENGDHVQSFALTKDRFPYLYQGQTITINQVDLFGVPKADKEASMIPNLTPPGVNQQEIIPNDGASVGQLLHKFATPLSVKVEVEKESAAWSFNVPKDDVQKFVESVEDILVAVTYTVTVTKETN